MNLIVFNQKLKRMIAAIPVAKNISVLASTSAAPYRNHIRNLKKKNVARNAIAAKDTRPTNFIIYIPSDLKSISSCIALRSRCMIPGGIFLHLDRCMALLIRALNQDEWETLGSCCGHGKYSQSIVVKHADGHIFDLISSETIPRKTRFYRKDKQGLYYIPEAVEIMK